MSNSGISKEPERSRMKRKINKHLEESFGIERVSDGRDYWSEKRSLASRTGNLIMGSSLGSGQQGSLMSQSGG